jgi:hypothetical protein
MSVPRRAQEERTEVVNPNINIPIIENGNIGRKSSV